MSKPIKMKGKGMPLSQAFRSGSVPTVAEDSFIMRSMSAKAPTSPFTPFLSPSKNSRAKRNHSFKSTQKIVMGDARRRLASPRDVIGPVSTLSLPLADMKPPDEPAPPPPGPPIVSDWKVHSPMELRRSTFTLEEPCLADSNAADDGAMWSLHDDDAGDYGNALLSLSTEIGVEMMDSSLDFSYWEQSIEPPYLYTVMTFVLKHSVGVKGVFRTPASTVRLTQLREAELNGRLEEELAQCVTKMTGRLLVADFMNKHFRDLREPLVPPHVFHEALDAVDVEVVDFPVREKLRSLMYNLPNDAIGSFCALLHVAHEALKHSAKTGMDVTALSLCLGRTVMYDTSPSLDVIAVRREVRLMSKAMSILIQDFPAMYQDFITGMRKVKAETMVNRLAIRKRLIDITAATEAQQSVLTRSSPSQSPLSSPRRDNLVSDFLPTRSASSVPLSSSERKSSIPAAVLSPREVRSPKKRVAKYLSRRVSVTLRRGSDGKSQPTDDEVTKHRMLEAINVALLNKSNQRIWNLSFDEVQEILLKAGFPGPVILRYEKFLQQATLKLVAGMYKS